MNTKSERLELLSNRGLPVKNKTIVAAISVIIVFLAGFVPEYARARRLDSELRAVRQDCAGAELRDLAGLVYFQATQKNYGLARDTGQQFFNRVREVANQTTDAGGRKALEGLITLRDKVMAGLAKADVSAVGDSQDLFTRTRQATVRPTAGQR
jgi:hypothetical protein